MRTYVSEASRQELINPGHNQATSSSHDHLRNRVRKLLVQSNKSALHLFDEPLQLSSEQSAGLSVMHPQLISGYSHLVKGLANFHEGFH
jgi:hypothetical protein